MGAVDLDVLIAGLLGTGCRLAVQPHDPFDLGDRQLVRHGDAELSGTGDGATHGPDVTCRPGA